MTRIVFLDFDGVIMTEASYRAAVPLPNGLEHGTPEWNRAVARRRMDPALVARVSRLCELAGAEVVLSTAWRPSEPAGLLPLVEALRLAGLSERVEVAGFTPCLYGPGFRARSRGDEIAAWLDEHRPGWTRDQVVVLDDEDHIAPLEDRWVRSTWTDGFGRAQLVEALRLFGLDLPTVHVTNHASRKLHRGRVYTIMAKPRRWEHGAGVVRILTPNPDDLDAARAGTIDTAEYRARFEARIAHADFAPGALLATTGTELVEVRDGDTLCCSCSREVAARGECHRAWAAVALARAGWRVVLDGVELLTSHLETR